MASALGGVLVSHTHVVAAFLAAKQSNGVRGKPALVLSQRSTHGHADTQARSIDALR